MQLLNSVDCSACLALPLLSLSRCLSLVCSVLSIKGDTAVHLEPSSPSSSFSSFSLCRSSRSPSRRLNPLFRGGNFSFSLGYPER